MCVWGGGGGGGGGVGGGGGGGGGGGRDQFSVNNENTKWKSLSTRRLEVMQPRTMRIRSEFPVGK